MNVCKVKSISVRYGTDWETGGLVVISIKLRTSLPTVSPGMYRIGPPPLPQTKLNLHIMQMKDGCHGILCDTQGLRMRCDAQRRTGDTEIIDNNNSIKLK